MRMGKILLAVLAVGLMASTANADIYVWFTANGAGAEGTSPVIEVNKGDIVTIEAWGHGSPFGDWTGQWSSFGGDVMGPGLTTSFDPLANISGTDWPYGRSGIADGDAGSPLLIDNVGGTTDVPGHAPSAFVRMFYFQVEITSDFSPSDFIVLGMQGSGSPEVFAQYYGTTGAYSTGYVYFGGDQMPDQGTNAYGYHEMITLHVLPEPATLVLLGFGALALIRRR